MSLIIALLKINITLALCYLLYQLLLRRLTFYNLNRVFLLSAVALSSAMPFIHIQLATPATKPVAILTAARSYSLPTALPAAFDYTDIIQLLFWTGAALMALRLIFQLLSVFRLYFRSRDTKFNDTTLHILPGQGNPFSFFRGIFLYQDRLADQELPMIIAHEKIHAKQWHSIDILICELHRAFCWFNPVAWLLMRAVRQNLEFIADRAVLQTGTAAKTYQYSLLRVSQSSNAAPVLANNFNFSNLKTRIIMMNKKQSSPIHAARYFVAAPLALALVCCFGVSMGQQKKQTLTPTPQKTETVTATDPQITLTPAAGNAKQKAGSDKVKSVRITKTENTPEGKEERTAVVEMESGETRTVHLDQPGAAPMLQDKARPMVILDGQKISYGEMEAIDPKGIKSVTILKDAESIQQYGDEAKDGVIVIVMKEKKATKEKK